MRCSSNGASPRRSTGCRGRPGRRPRRRFYLEQSQTEIAAATGVPLGTVDADDARPPAHGRRAGGGAVSEAVDYLLGEMEPDRAARFAAELERDAALRAEVERLRPIVTRLERSPETHGRACAAAAARVRGRGHRGAVARRARAGRARAGRAAATPPLARPGPAVAGLSRRLLAAGPGSACCSTATPSRDATRAEPDRRRRPGREQAHRRTSDRVNVRVERPAADRRRRSSTRCVARRGQAARRPRLVPGGRGRDGDASTAAAGRPGPVQLLRHLARAGRR